MVGCLNIYQVGNGHTNILKKFLSLKRYWCAPPAPASGILSAEHKILNFVINP